MNKPIDEPLIIKLYSEQPRPVDDLPHMFELPEMVATYNKHKRIVVPITRRDAHLSLQNLRKARRLVRKSRYGDMGSGRMLGAKKRQEEKDRRRAERAKVAALKTSFLIDLHKSQPRALDDLPFTEEEKAIVAAYNGEDLDEFDLPCTAAMQALVAVHGAVHEGPELTARLVWVALQIARKAGKLGKHDKR